jgi:hypothetical protein
MQACRKLTFFRIPLAPARHTRRATQSPKHDPVIILEEILAGHDPDGDLRANISDSTLNSKYVPPLLKKAQDGNFAAADALTVLAAFMPAVQVASIGRDLLDISRKYGACRYKADFVRAAEIPTALSALENPACAASDGPEIQRAIADATTHVPAGDVDRWTFAREWVQPNAKTYGYDPERFNGFYACYLHPLLESFNPFHSRRRID